VSLKVKTDHTTRQNTDVEYCGFTYVLLSTALNPPAQVLVNKENIFKLTVDESQLIFKVDQLGANFLS